MTEYTAVRNALDGHFYPARGTSDDAVAVQAAINAAVAAGGGTVNLGNKSWNMLSGITYDTSRVCMVGAHATLSWYNANGSTVTAAVTLNQPNGSPRGQNLQNEIRGVRFVGNGGNPAVAAGTLTLIGIGLSFVQPTNPNQEVSQLNIYNPIVSDFNIGMAWFTNAYIIKVFGGVISAVSVAVQRTGTGNNGEAINFYGTTLAGTNKRLVEIFGPNSDTYFFGGSLDYWGKRVAYTDARLEFHGVHVEGNGTGNEPFECDNGGSIIFIGGDISAGNSNYGAYLCNIYGNRGRFEMHGAMLNTRPWNTALCSKPECTFVSFNYSGQNKEFLASTGTVTVDALSAPQASCLVNGNITLANPINGFANSRMTIFLKQGSAGGFGVAFGTKYKFRDGVTPIMPSTAGSYMLIETVYDAFNDVWWTTGSTGVNNTVPTVNLSANQSKAEGNSGAVVFTYTVTRSNSSGAINVPWSFAAGTTNATDYTGGTLPTGGTVAIADGATTGTFSISVNGDTVSENDETFTVTITAPSGYTVGSASTATGTITNDDATQYTATGKSAKVNYTDPAGDTTPTGYTSIVTGNMLTTTALLSPAGAATNWTAQTTLKGNDVASNINGSTTGNNSGVYTPDSVMVSNWYTSTPAEVETYAGLDSTKSYDVYFFGSRDAVTGWTTDVFLTGLATSPTQTLDVSANTSRRLLFAKIKPDANGRINLSWAKGSASAGTFGRMGVVELVEYSG